MGADEAVSTSFKIAIYSIVLTVVIGLPLGIYTAVKANSIGDKISTVYYAVVRLHAQLLDRASSGTAVFSETGLAAVFRLYFI